MHLVQQITVVVVIRVFSLCHHCWITSYFVLCLTCHTSNFVHLLGSLHILSLSYWSCTHQTLCTFLNYFIFYPVSYWSHIKICAPSWITSCFILYLTCHTSNFLHLLGSLHILCFILPVTHQTSCTFLDHFIYQTLCTFLDHFMFDLLSYFSCTHQILCTFLDHFIFYPLTYWSHIKLSAPPSIALYFILYLTSHTSNFIHPPILKWETYENSKMWFESFRWVLIQFHGSICLEFTACQSAKCSHCVWVQNPAEGFPLLYRPFHKPRRTIPVAIDYVYVNVSAYVCEWWVFVVQKDLCSIRAIHYYYYWYLVFILFLTESH